LQGASLSGAVRQDTFGKLPDVPVPKKINSIAVVGRAESGGIFESDISRSEEAFLNAWGDKKEVPLARFRNRIKKKFQATA
jgi:hypothetical protein